MRPTTFIDYSLRVLICPAAEPGRRATIAQARGPGVHNRQQLALVPIRGRALASARVAAR